MFVSSIESEVSVTDQKQFFETFQPTPVDRVIEVDANINAVFQYTSLPFNLTDVDDSTPEQINVHQPQAYKNTVYSMFQYYKFHRSNGDGWAGLRNATTQQTLAYLVKKQLEHLFDAGDEHSLVEETGETTFVDPGTVQRWVNGQQIGSNVHTFGVEVFKQTQVMELMDACTDAGLFELVTGTPRADPISGEETTAPYLRLLLPEGTKWGVRVVVKTDPTNMASWLVQLKQSSTAETIPAYDASSEDVLSNSSVYTDPYNPPGDAWTTEPLTAEHTTFNDGPGSHTPNQMVLELVFGNPGGIV